MITRTLHQLQKIFFPFCYSYNPTLDNSKNVLSTWQVRKKKMVYQCTEERCTKFILKQPCQFIFITFFCHCISNSVSVPVKCAWYLHSLLILLLYICFNELLITDPLSRRFKLARVDCIIIFSVHMALFCLLCALTIFHA